MDFSADGKCIQVSIVSIAYFFLTVTVLADLARMTRGLFYYCNGSDFLALVSTIHEDVFLKNYACCRVDLTVVSSYRGVP